MGPHGKTAWYVGPVMEHYRNFTFYIPETGGTRTSASIQFFPHYCTMLRISNADAITIAADDLLQALLDPKMSKNNLRLNEKHYGALKELAKIFNTASKKPPMILKPPPAPVLEPMIQKKNEVTPKPKDKNILTSPTLIPPDETNAKFSKFIERPSTYQYNTCHRNTPHVIPVSYNIVNDKRKKCPIGN